MKVGGWTPLRLGPVAESPDGKAVSAAQLLGLLDSLRNDCARYSERVKELEVRANKATNALEGR